MDISTYIKRMNQLYGSEQQVASNPLNIPAHMQHQLDEGQLTPEEFYQHQSIPQSERPLTGAEGGRVYDTRKYFSRGQLVQPGPGRPGYRGDPGDRKRIFKTKISRFSNLPKDKQGVWKWQREGKGKDLYQRAGESYRDFIKRVKDVKSQKRVVSAGEKFADWLKTNYGSNKKIDKRMKELIFESGIEITEGNARTYLTKNNKSLLNKVRTSGVLNIPQMPEGKGVQELWNERYKTPWEKASWRERDFFINNYKSILAEKVKLKKGNYISADELMKMTGLDKEQIKATDTALGRYIRKFLKPVRSYQQHVDEAGQTRQINYYKKPTEVQLNKLTEFTGTATKLRQKTVDLINELYPKYRHYYQNGKLPPLKKVLEAFPNKTAHAIGFAETRIAQMLDGATFPKDPELIKIKPNKSKANLLFEAFDNEPWGTPRATGIRSVAMGAIESRLGYDAGTIDQFKQEIRRILKQHNIPIYDPKKKYSKNNFGFQIDEFASLTGSGRSKAPEFSQFINFAEGKMNMGQLAKFQIEFNKTRDAIEANPKNMAQELKKFKKIRDGYVQTLGVDLADIKPGLASQHYSKEFLEEAKKTRHVGRRIIPGIDLEAASKRVGHTVIVPEEYRTFSQALEKQNRPTLTKNIKQLKEGVMKFFGEYDEKKAFKKFYDYMDKATPSQIKKIMKFIPKIAQADDISDRRYASADNIMTDATYVDETSPVTEAGMVPEFITRNPKTSIVAGGALSKLSGRVGGPDPLKYLRKVPRKIVSALGTPTGAVAAWPLAAMGMKKAGWIDEDTPAFDIKSTGDRIGAEAELALAPELVKWTSKLTKPIKNQAARSAVTQLLNLGMKPATAMRVARTAQPLGLLSLGGEGLYHMYKKGHFDKERMMPSLMDQGAYEAAQQEQFDVNQPMLAAGGRVPFGKGKVVTGIDKGRRAFMKWLAGITGAGIAAGTGLIKFGKTIGKGKTVVKAGDHIIQGTPGMPDWYIPLINRIVKEGDDVTAKLGTVEREIVHTKKIGKGEEVTVYQNLDTGNVRVTYGPLHPRASNDLSTVHLEYRAPEVIDSGKMKGQKTKPEFDAVESEPKYVAVGPDDAEVQWDFDNVVGNVDDLTTDTSKLKEFGTKRKLTHKDKVKAKKKQKYRQQLEEDTSTQVDYSASKYGEGDDTSDLFDEFGNYIGD